MPPTVPIESSRYIVEQLQSANYEVEYREFDGPHAVSLTLAREVALVIVTAAAPATCTLEPPSPSAEAFSVVGASESAPLALALVSAM